MSQVRALRLLPGDFHNPRAAAQAFECPRLPGSKEKIMTRTLAFLFAASCCISAAYAQQHDMIADKDVKASLKGTAPDNVIEHATLMNMGADGKMKVVQQGTNGWTCMPGRVGTVGAPSPMCADKAGMEWVEAWLNKGSAPQKLGFIYMMHGDNGASNSDPYATKEAPDNNWVMTGPHVMIVGGEAKGMMQAYPRTPKVANAHEPYVMWPGTPYEHLMLPTK
jgi:hypothetical protein